VPAIHPPAKCLYFNTILTHDEIAAIFPIEEFEGKRIKILHMKMLLKILQWFLMREKIYDFLDKAEESHTKFYGEKGDGSIFQRKRGRFYFSKKKGTVLFFDGFL
jgi:hypothetical protein